MDVNTNLAYLYRHPEGMRIVDQSYMFISLFAVLFILACPNLKTFIYFNSFDYKRMVVKTKLAYGFQKCVGDLWLGEDYHDFTVLVEDTSFQCHRFILSACSKFFRALLRTDMTENQVNSARLRGMTPSTFNIIMNAIYKGEDGLTKDNIIDIWYASDELQINYLISECEEFVLKILSNQNYFLFYQHAKVLKSVRVSQEVEKFMLRNFVALRNTGMLLELPADDLYRLIQSHALNLNSEDLVLESVLEWVKHIPQDSGDTCCANKSGVTLAYLEADIVKESGQNDMKGGNDQIITAAANKKSGPVLPDCQDLNLYPENTLSSNTKNEILPKEREATPAEPAKNFTKATQTIVNGLELNDRHQHLKMLITGVRLHLVSLEILQNLLKQDIILFNREVCDIVLESTFYQLQVERRHGPWPESAIYRDCSSMEHVVVYGIGTQLKAYSLKNNTIHEIARLCDNRNSCQNICVFDNVVYISLLAQHHKCNTLTMYSRSGHLSKVTDNFISISRADHLLIQGKYIYCLNTSGQVNHFRPESGYETLWLTHPQINISRISSAITFENYIICFCDSSSQTTHVKCYDPELCTLWDMSDFKGPKNNIVAFSDGKQTYLLQRNGVLNKILNIEPSSENFSYVSQLWSGDWELCGAVLFHGQLFVFGNAPLATAILNSLPGVFDSISLVPVVSGTRCWPMVLPKSRLK